MRFPSAGAARPHDRAQRLDGATLPADHLAAVLLGNEQLEHDRVVVLVETLDLDLVGIVDERARQELEQVLQLEIPLALSSRLTVWVG